MRYTGEQPYSEDAALAFVVKRIAEQAASPRERYELAIELAETRDMIGTAGARWIRTDQSEASIGYILRRDCWGRGYATEAGRALLRLGFDGMRAHRLLGICDIENTASTRDMDKLGMKLEGTHRQESWSVPLSE
jgi:RimJ/RimL family protein N-acetyltransferase